METVQTRTMRDQEYPSSSMRSKQKKVVPWSQTKGLVVSTDPNEVQQGDISISINKETEKYREAPDSSHRVMGYQLLISQPQLQSQSRWVYLKPTYPCIITAASGMITIANEFFKILMNTQRAKDTRVRVFKTDMTTLYKQMRLGVRTRVEQAQA